MIAVFDTNVIIHAVAQARTTEEATKKRVARELVMKMEVVHIAAVSAFELEWAQKEGENFDEVVRSWDVLALDTVAKDHAVAIARKAMNLGQMCPTCWNFLPHTTACAVCASHGSRQRRMNDVLIAGTLLAHDASIFYTFNVADFQRHLSGTPVQVLRPPDGTPLFARTDTADQEDESGRKS